MTGLGGPPSWFARTCLVPIRGCRRRASHLRARTLSSSRAKTIFETTQERGNSPQEKERSCEIAVQAPAAESICKASHSRHYECGCPQPHSNFGPKHSDGEQHYRQSQSSKAILRWARSFLLQLSLAMVRPSFRCSLQPGVPVESDQPKATRRSCHCRHRFDSHSRSPSLLPPAPQSQCR